MPPAVTVAALLALARRLPHASPGVCPCPPSLLLCGAAALTRSRTASGTVGELPWPVLLLLPLPLHAPPTVQHAT